jgi:hypothetical protein
MIWAKALLDARGTGWSSVWGGGNGSLRASCSHDGPIRYIVTEGEAMRQLQVPLLDAVKTALEAATVRHRRELPHGSDCSTTYLQSQIYVTQ